MKQFESIAALPRTKEFSSGRAAVLFPAIAAILFGLFIVWGVGLASPMMLHNAAHDSRHSLGFPCH